MRKGMDSMFRELCRWEVGGGTSGMVTNDSETFRTLISLIDALTNLLDVFSLLKPNVYVHQ